MACKHTVHRYEHITKEWKRLSRLHKIGYELVQVRQLTWAEAL